MSERLRDPKGGLTAAGRKHFKRTEGADLRPGVKGPADTPEKMRRKGSFLSRFYGRSDVPPLTKPTGEPKRYALAARAWGENAPTSMEAVRALAAKGRTLLKRYAAKKQK
jgi:hypothetical protein